MKKHERLQQECYDQNDLWQNLWHYMPYTKVKEHKVPIYKRKKKKFFD